MSATIEVDRLEFIERNVYAGRGTSVALHRVQVEGLRLLYKEYRPTTDAPAGPLLDLVTWANGLTGNSPISNRCALPTHVIVRGERVLGVCLPEAGTEYLYKTSRRELRPRTLDHLTVRDDDTTAGFVHYPPDFKLAVLGQLLEVLLDLHARSVVVGDLNAHNVLITVSRPRLFIIDCDSFWIDGAASLGLAEDTSLHCWFEPSRFTARTDLYKFAALCVRSLRESVADGPIDEKQLHELLPADHVDSLLALLKPGAAPSVARLKLMARAWRTAVGPNEVVPDHEPGPSARPSDGPDGPATTKTQNEAEHISGATQGARGRRVLWCVAAVLGLVVMALLIVLIIG